MLRDATVDEIETWRAGMLAHVNNMESELKRLEEELQDEVWTNEDYLGRMVQVEAFYRFQLGDKEQAQYFLNLLHGHGVYVTRYDFGAWGFVKDLCGDKHYTHDEVLKLGQAAVAAYQAIYKHEHPF